MRARDAYLLGIDLVASGGAAALLPEIHAEAEPAEVADRVVAEQTSPPDGPVLRPMPGASSLKPTVLPSAISGVSDEAWTDFAIAMRTAQPGTISASNDHGMFAMKMRRLADLGLVKDLVNKRSPTGRMMWIGTFVSPLTAKKLLGDAKLQYKVFTDSMANYVKRLRGGEIEQPDGGPTEDMTLSGILAILHRAGPGGLKGWNDEESRFPETLALYERTNGIF